MKMKTARYEIYAPAVPPAFDGFTIAHVTDLHNREFGNELIERITAVQPDCIAITGDSVHRENESAAAEKFALGAVQIAPVFYVTGNHEQVLESYPAFADYLRDVGVRVLENSYEILRRENEAIAILGMHDPRFFAGGKPEFCNELARLHAEIQNGGVEYTVL
ncbi:MAG: metallophosphoesterase, partial [Clostridiales bacterium]|nr:metallophosphoesterase [Clostridiales bacterium]